MASHLRPETEQAEIERLRAENAELRAQIVGASPTPSEKPSEEQDGAHPLTVLLTPDPNDLSDKGKLGPIALANVTRTMLEILRARRPDAGWVAEHDLEAVPVDTPCYQLGDVVTKMWDGTVPRSHVVERDDGGKKRLRRILVEGEPDSDRFRAGYDHQLQMVSDMIGEAEIAQADGASHHAHALTLMVNLVFARLRLALAYFDDADGRWRAVLAEPRPEFDPRSTSA